MNLTSENSFLHHPRGYSLVEGLIVIALAALIMLAFIPNIVRTMREYSVRSTASQIATDIRFARNASVKKRVNYQIQIQDEDDSPDPNSYTVTSDTGSRKIALSKNIIIDSDTSTSGFTFTTRGGILSGSGNIVLRRQGISGFRYQITVTPAGGVEVSAL